jgi:signal transduction histidine kinase
MARPRRRGYREHVNRHGVIAARGDVLLAGLVGVLFFLEVASEARFAADRVVGVLAALLFSATLAARRRAPLVALSVGVGVIVLSNRTGPPLADTATFVLGFGVALYSTGRYAVGRNAVAGGLVVAAALPLAVFEPGRPFSVADSAFIAIFIVGPWAAGVAIGRRQRREHGLKARAAALELERDTKAREAVAQERARIARELHDAVGHAISVMVLQARGGRRMLASDPDETRLALEAIDRTGALALAEMRTLLGLLRRTDEDATLVPRPSMKRIDELVASVGGTGMPVDLTVEGEPVDLAPGLDASAYRIVQEALTNTLKHAGPARAHVIVRYTPENLELEVLDDGTGNADGTRPGHGLAGLRERVAIFGGELESGTRAGGGYAMRASLPLGSADR